MVAGVGLEREDLQMMVKGYYRARGWSDDGMIPDEKLQELGLSELSKPVAPAS